MKGRNLILSLITGCLMLALVAGPAVAESTLKVGIIGPFTGPSAKSGAEFKGSVTMAFEKVNYKVGDYKLKPVWIDSQSDPAKVVSAYAEACERIGIQAGVLNWHSSTAVSAMDVAAQYKVPHMFSFGATEVVNEKWTSDPEKTAIGAVRDGRFPAN